MYELTAALQIQYSYICGYIVIYFVYKCDEFFVGLRCVALRCVALGCLYGPGHAQSFVWAIAWRQSSTFVYNLYEYVLCPVIWRRAICRRSNN